MCTICKPVCLPEEVFSGLMPFPDPMPGSDGHYQPFDEVFGKEMSEVHRPSLQTKAKRKKTLPFHGVLQHVRNVNMMLLWNDVNYSVTWTIGHLPVVHSYRILT